MKKYVFYGWETAVDWAAYMESNDITDISTLCTGTIGLESIEYISEYQKAGVSIKEFDKLSVEYGFLSLGGVSIELKAPIRITWYNQTNVLQFDTWLFMDDTLMRRYVETVIRRSFGTEDAMKLAKPVPEEDP